MNNYCVHKTRHLIIPTKPHAGDTKIAFTEDVSKRYEALGWHVLHVEVSIIVESHPAIYSVRLQAFLVRVLGELNWYDCSQYLMAINACFVMQSMLVICGWAIM